MASEQPSSTQAAFFLDIFRRADKNDNGELSKSEFLSYFQDGVLSADELVDLFDKIDTGKNGTIEIDELTAFFQTHLKDFSGMFDALSTMNEATSTSLSAIHPPAESEQDLFLNRFFLREISHAIQSIQAPIDATHDVLVRDALTRRPEVYPLQTIKPQDGSSTADFTLTRRHTTSKADTQYTGLEDQVERLAGLVDKLAGKTSFGSIEQVKSESDLCILASYEMSVLSSTSESFQQELGRYVAGLRTAHNCIKCSTVYDDDTVTLYEIWQSHNDLNAHTQSESYRSFHKALVDCLQCPLKFQMMDTPTSWWI